MPTDPRDTAYYSAPRNRQHPQDAAGNRRNYTPHSGYDPTEWEERQHERHDEDADKESYWGPPPSEDLIPEHEVRHLTADTPVPYPTDPGRPPSNSVGSGGTPPPVGQGPQALPPLAGLPPNLEPGGVVPPNLSGPSGWPFPKVPLPGLPGLGLVPGVAQQPPPAPPEETPGSNPASDWYGQQHQGSATQRFLAAKGYADSYRQQNRERKPLQDPHYDDYGPEENDWEHQREHEAAHYPADHRPWTENSGVDPTQNALEEGERFFNRDPALGWGPPRFVGGDPQGVVSIEPAQTAGPQDARVLPKHQTGLGYDAIARPGPGGKGWDVLKPLS